MPGTRIVSRVRHAAAATLPSAALCAGLTLALAGCIGGPAPDTLPAAARDTVPLGYGNTTKGQNTAAVGTVFPDDLDANVTRVEEMLRGRVAGVQVTPDGHGGYSIRIRGTSTANSSAEPLVVLDGMPMQGVSNPFAGLSPHDIERIDVLKDAAATSIYGSRGANGVILITSKRARKDPAAQ